MSLRPLAPLAPLRPAEPVPAADPDMILHNGKAVTVDAAFSVSQVVPVQCRTIVRIAFRGPHAEMIDPGGETEAQAHRLACPPHYCALGRDGSRMAHCELGHPARPSLTVCTVRRLVDV